MIARRENLAVVSAALTAICVIPYLRDIRRGTTRPQRVSWLVFATLSVVAAVSQIAAGGGPGVWLAGGSAFGFTLVFVASIRHGEGGFAASDRIALAIATAGVIASLVVDIPMVAVISVVVAEVSAVSLTASKARRDPASETPSTWLLDSIAGALAIVALSSLSFAELLYPVHHTLVNLWVVLAIIDGRRRQPAVANSAASSRARLARSERVSVR